MKPIPTVGEVKRYLGLDGEEQNTLLEGFISAAKDTVEKVLRYKLCDDMPAIVNTAVKYYIWQLYFHRDGGEFDAAKIENTIAVMLSGIRKTAF